MALRKSAGLTTASGRVRGSVYTAQTVADFCEVDLKTVHHWADRGKVPHFRTDGRHLRFRRNDIVRFLRAHGYPLPEALVKARPTVALALASAMLDGGALSLDELAKRLTSRFSVRRHASGVAAVAHLVAEAPDVLVLAWGDPTIGFPSAIEALKADPATSWIAIATVGADSSHLAGLGDETTRPDIMLTTEDVARLPGELARTLAVNT